jgi:hypothetical protein
MERPSRVFTRSAPFAAPPGYAPFDGAPFDGAAFDGAPQLQEDCRLARAARVNLLLIHGEGVLRDLAAMLDLRKPVATWCPGELLVLPPVASARTMILQDVGALTDADQRRLLDWLDQAAGRTQVVSTTAVSLWPRVQAGAFADSLYYRLNTVCMDLDHFGSLADSVPAQSQ